MGGVDTSRPEQDTSYFAYNIFKYISLNESSLFYQKYH